MKSKSANQDSYIKSPLKWAGGKSKLLKDIFSLIPSEFAHKRFVDVFSGSGVVGINSSTKSLWINDFNEDLITLYSCLKNNKKRFLKETKELFCGKYNNQESFNAIRKEFNESKVSKYRKAAIFVYLNKHCFNGLCRYNSSGGFNVPFGRYPTNPSLNYDEIDRFADRLKNAVLTSLSFENVLNSCGQGDVVYCDPPYAPLDQKSNFTAYAGNPFNEFHQAQLAELAELAAGRGALIIISNHDTEFTRNLYINADVIKSFEVGRSISSSGTGRNKVSELIAVYSVRKAKMRK